MLIGLDPILAEEPKMLILGSMPSVASLEKQEYYGFAHNRFWKIMNDVFHMPIDTYEQKIAIMKTNHIILWDVIGQCVRDGSLDSNIRNITVNPIKEILENNPTVKIVICNGQKSYAVYQKYFSNIAVTSICLPSTSNANRSLKEEMIFQNWREVLIKCE